MKLRVGVVEIGGRGVGDDPKQSDTAAQSR